jgi:septum formation protein
VKAKSLLVASSSPRRVELLAGAGFKFKIVKPKVSERTDPHLTARELTGWNAVRKGMDVAKAHPRDIVLAADTVVALDQKIIGKPNDLTDAARILRSLSGRAHHVYSSVFMVHLSQGNALLFCEISKVEFRKLNATEIRSYLAGINPLDKAGAYAAQGHGTGIIARIDGSYSNVVGLPMEKTVVALAGFGIQPVRRPIALRPSRAVPARARQVRGAKRGRGTRR